MVQNEEILSCGGKGWERRVVELGNVGHWKRGLTFWRGGRGRDGLVSSEMWHIAKRGLTSWRGGRGGSGLVSSETWHVGKRVLTDWRRGRGGAIWCGRNHGMLDMTIHLLCASDVE